jgi:predicted dehydrogenase
MSELRVAVIGCSGIGAVHLHCWANLSGARIAAVCDRKGMVAARAAGRIEGAAAFTDVGALLAAETFDVVDVCVPPAERFAAAGAALRSGAHILCETPPALTPAEADALVSLAQERERLLMPAFCHRFHPPILFAKELVDNDDLGRPTMFRCRFSGAALLEGDTADPPEEGEPIGVVLDTALHGIDLFRYLFGEISDITGRMARNTPGLPVEDSAALLLQSSRGAVGVVEAVRNTPAGRNMVELYGTAGACLIDYDLGTLRYTTADQPFWQTREEGGLNGFEREIAHFADAVRGLQPLIVTGADGARAVELCHRVYAQNPLHGSRPPGPDDPRPRQ